MFEFLHFIEKKNATTEVENRFLRAFLKHLKMQVVRVEHSSQWEKMENA